MPETESQHLNPGQPLTRLPRQPAAGRNPGSRHLWAAWEGASPQEGSGRIPASSASMVMGTRALDYTSQGCLVYVEREVISAERTDLGPGRERERV